MTHNPETVERVAFLRQLHSNLCYEQGDHEDEVDTAYSAGADAIEQLAALPPQNAPLWQGPEDIEEIMDNVMDVDVGTKELAEALFAEYQKQARPSHKVRNEAKEQENGS